MPTTIVIGKGISAVAYLASVHQYLGSLNKGLGNVHVVGSGDLWQKISHRHAMGQPQQLLTGNLLGTGRESRGFEPQQLQDNSFMTAGNFSRLLKLYLRDHTYGQIPDSYVSRITKEGSQYVVSIRIDGRMGGSFRCDNVIFAPGPGTARALALSADTEEVLSADDMRAFGKQVIQGNDFMFANWTPPSSKPLKEMTIAVYGGSATAAWVVELADIQGMNVVCWFTRPGDPRDIKAWDTASKFRDAFPAGGRNSHVQEKFRDIRHVCKLMGIKRAEDSTKIKLALHGQDGSDLLIPPVDLLVYALGAEHTATTGIREVLDPELNSSLVAFYDKNLAISSKPTLLAIGTEDRSLMIVGSAMSSMAGFGTSNLKLQGNPTQLKEGLASYRTISDTLPEAARPVEGIAMVMAGVEALNEYIPVQARRGGRTATFTAPALRTSNGSPNPDAGRVSHHEIDFNWDINFNTSNRTQLAVFIAQATDLNALAANLAVGLILHFRTQPNSVRGLSDPQVNAIITGAGRIYKTMAKNNKNIDEIILRREKVLKEVDKVITEIVEYYTSTPAWREYWQKQGVTMLRAAL